MTNAGFWRGIPGLCLALLLCSSGDALLAAEPAGSWPQFLGPTRDGISSETGLIDSWPAGGLKQAWRVKGGVGMSGIAVADGKAITMVQREGRQLVIALDAGNGTLLWQTAVGAAFQNPMGHGPRATPTIAAGLVHVFTGDGHTATLALADGTLQWQHDSLKGLGGRVADYGMVCSPLVDGNNVIVTVGAQAGTVVAYDTKTGKPQWSSGQGDSAGYSSPVVIKLAGKRQLVTFNGQALIGTDPANGNLLWRYEYKTDYDCNIMTPLSVKGQVFISAGENHGSTLLSVVEENGKYQLKETWESLGVQSVLRCEWQTPIQLGGYLYGFDNVGGAGPISHLTCIEAATGRRVWQQTRFGKGNMIAADGKLIMTTLKGELVIVKASHQGFEELGRQQALDRTRQAPSLAGGLLYVRDDQEIACFDLRKQ